MLMAAGSKSVLPHGPQTEVFLSFTGFQAEATFLAT